MTRPAIVIGLLVLTLSTLPSLTIRARAGAGRVVSLAGSAVRAASVEALETGGAPLAAGAEIEPGDVLRTGDDGSLTLVFGASRTRITLGPASTLVVSTYLQRLEQRRIESSSLFSLLAGKLRFITGRLFGKGDSMTIKAESSWCAIRGTSGYVEVRSGGGALFANVTGDGATPGEPTMFVLGGALPGLPQDPAQLYQRILDQGRGLTPGFTVEAVRNALSEPTRLDPAVMGRILPLVTGNQDQRKLLGLAVATAARAIGSTLRGPAAAAELKREIRGFLDAARQGLGPALSPDLGSSLLEQGQSFLQSALPGGTAPTGAASSALDALRTMAPETLNKLLEGASASVQVERVVPLDGNNPLSATDPVAAAPTGTTVLDLTTTFGDFGFFAASIDIDPVTRVATVRPDGTGSALGITVNADGTGMQGQPLGGWSAPNVWGFSSLNPFLLVEPYSVVPWAPNVLILKHEFSPLTVTVSYVVEQEGPSAFPLYTATDFTLRLVSVTFQ
jgi:hypothetical protein